MYKLIAPRFHTLFTHYLIPCEKKTSGSSSEIFKGFEEPRHFILTFELRGCEIKRFEAPGRGWPGLSLDLLAFDRGFVISELVLRRVEKILPLLLFLSLVLWLIFTHFAMITPL